MILLLLFLLVTVLVLLLLLLLLLNLIVTVFVLLLRILPVNFVVVVVVVVAVTVISSYLMLPFFSTLSPILLIDCSPSCTTPTANTFVLYLLPSLLSFYYCCWYCTCPIINDIPENEMKLMA